MPQRQLDHLKRHLESLEAHIRKLTEKNRPQRVIDHVTAKKELIQEMIASA